MKVYYWCPYLSKLALVKSLLNSCKSLNKKKVFETILLINKNITLNIAGEGNEKN